MRIPFWILAALIAVLVYAGLVGKAYFDFGMLDFRFDLLPYIIGGWLAAVVLGGVIGMVRKALIPHTLDELPEDSDRP